MPTNFQLTNSLSTLAPEGTEVVAVAFINRGEFAMLNTCDAITLDSLTSDERIIANAFIDMMKTKVLACVGGGADPAS
jgi:hypothetical protein